jgi:hypothetical protein
VGSHEALAHPVGSWLGLPAVGVEQPGQGVGRLVAGPVLVGGGPPQRLGAQVAELVGPVAVAEGEHRPGRPDADGARRAGRPGGGRVVAEVVHHLGEGGPLAREQVGERQVGGEAGRLPLGRLGPGGRGPAQLVAQPAPEGAVVVGRPGVVGTGVHDVQGPSRHRRAHAALADGLKGGLVPDHRDVVAHRCLLRRQRGNCPAREGSNGLCPFRCRGDAALLPFLTTVR